MHRHLFTRQTTALLLAACLLGLTVSCATVEPIPPEVNLMSLEMQDVTLSHANMLADLRVFNPNDFELTVEHVYYVLHLNDIKVVAGRSIPAVRIGPQEYQHLTLRLASAYWNILQLFNSMQGATAVTYGLEGEVTVSGVGLLGHTFPFAAHGSVPLRQLPGQPGMMSP